MEIDWKQVYLLIAYCLGSESLKQNRAGNDHFQHGSLLMTGCHFLYGEGQNIFSRFCLLLWTPSTYHFYFTAWEQCSFLSCVYHKNPCSNSYISPMYTATYFPVSLETFSPGCSRDLYNVNN